MELFGAGVGSIEQIGAGRGSFFGRDMTPSCFEKLLKFGPACEHGQLKDVEIISVGTSAFERFVLFFNLPTSRYCKPTPV